MDKVVLGDTGIEVTELCFGALPIGPGQKNVPVEEAAGIIALALKNGVSFIDTAQGYKTYPHIRRAIEIAGITPVISTKSPAESYEGMDAAVQEALSSLGLEVIDIFLLHAARAGTDIFEKRKRALECLLEYKKRGIIRAVGISTHAADVAMLAADRADIDVVFPIINKTGMGVLNGSKEDMEAAIKRCMANGKGVFFMKVLAGGNLINDYKDSITYARTLAGGRAAISIGMVSAPEVEMNVACFNGEEIGDDLPVAIIKRFIVLKSICIGCGKCVEACHSSAVAIGSDGKADIDEAKCLKCGYCVQGCPQFCIRMI